MPWRSAILLGIGDEDTVDAVAETEHDSERAARAWVETTRTRAAHECFAGMSRRQRAGGVP
jgi:hypothetical protein